jgi:serine/threonine-protein kinase
MPTAGQRVSEYVLEERVGQGAFGEVWRARHHVWSDQFVAVKIPTDPQYVRYLQREGRAMHGLKHPGIVRAINFDPYADPAYLVMEYVPGTSLRRVLQDRRALPARDAVAILRQVLEALDHAHRHGVVHQDVKPENVLVHERAHTDGFGAEGAVRLTDFGLGSVAALAGGASGNSIVMSHEARDDGRTGGGTHFYMAPEQSAGGPVDARADVYACGVMLFEMLTGDRPAGTELPGELNPAVPKHLDDAFRRAYARLDRRFGSAREFLAALDEGNAGAAPPQAAVTTRPPIEAPAAYVPPAQEVRLVTARPPVTGGQRALGGALAGLVAGVAFSLPAVPWTGVGVLAYGAMVGAVIGASLEWRRQPETSFLAIFAGLLVGAAAGDATGVGTVQGFLVGGAAALVALLITLRARGRGASPPPKAPPAPAASSGAPPRRARRRRDQAPQGIWPPPAE